jgi:hypothetical protein
MEERGVPVDHSNSQKVSANGQDLSAAEQFCALAS